MPKLPKGITMINERYTALLKETYPGIDIVPVEKYISPQAIIRHECKSCGMDFFDKPHNLINKADTILGHVCNESVFNRIGNNSCNSGRRFKNETEELDKLANALQLLSVGYGLEEVAEYMEMLPSFLLLWANKTDIKVMTRKGSTVEDSRKVKDVRGRKVSNSNYNSTEAKKLQLVREMLATAKEVSRLLESKAERENNTEGN